MLLLCELNLINMKSLKLLLVALVACCFVGCLETTEEITINANGSGTYNMSMDMGQLIDMIQTFIPEEERGKNKMDEVKDTIVNMKDFVDTAKDLSAEKKALFRDGTIRMQMNMKEKLFKISTNFPFKNAESFQKLYEQVGEGTPGGGVAGVLKGLGGDKKDLPGPPPGGKEPGMGQLTSFFDMVSKPGMLSRKVNNEKYKKLAQDSTMQQIKEMGSMMGEMKFTTAIKLPKAAKKVTGANAKLSEDKKTVLIKNSLTDLYENPSAFEFTVEY